MSAQNTAVVGSDKKTFKEYIFRAECQPDAEKFLDFCPVKLKYVTIAGGFIVFQDTPAPCPDAEVEVHFLHNLDLQSLLRLAQQIPDGHMIVETLELAENYTGIRKHGRRADSPEPKPEPESDDEHSEEEDLPEPEAKSIQSDSDADDFPDDPSESDEDSGAEWIPSDESSEEEDDSEEEQDTEEEVEEAEECTEHQEDSDFAPGANQDQQSTFDKGLLQEIHELVIGDGSFQQSYGQDNDFADDVLNELSEWKDKVGYGVFTQCKTCGLSTTEDDLQMSLDVGCLICEECYHNLPEEEKLSREQLREEIEKLKKQHRKDMLMCSFEHWCDPDLSFTIEDELRWLWKHSWDNEPLIKEIFDEVHEEEGYTYNLETHDCDVPADSDQVKDKE